MEELGFMERLGSSSNFSSYIKKPSKGSMPLLELELVLDDLPKKEAVKDEDEKRCVVIDIIDDKSKEKIVVFELR